MQACFRAESLKFGSVLAVGVKPARRKTVPWNPKRRHRRKGVGADAEDYPGVSNTQNEGASSEESSLEGVEPTGEGVEKTPAGTPGTSPLLAQFSQASGGSSTASDGGDEGPGISAQPVVRNSQIPVTQKTGPPDGDDGNVTRPASEAAGAPSAPSGEPLESVEGGIGVEGVSPESQDTLKQEAPFIKVGWLQIPTLKPRVFMERITFWRRKGSYVPLDFKVRFQSFQPVTHDFKIAVLEGSIASPWSRHVQLNGLGMFEHPLFTAFLPLA